MRVEPGWLKCNAAQLKRLWMRAHGLVLNCLPLLILGGPHAGRC